MGALAIERQQLGIEIGPAVAENAPVEAHAAIVLEVEGVDQHRFVGLVRLGDLGAVDPGEAATFESVRETATLVRDELGRLGMKPIAKTSGASGIHVYVPIVRGPEQKAVWGFAKAFAKRMEQAHPKLVTAEYRIADRTRGRVLVDYNQNAWGRTLASVYSVRPVPDATVSTPVTWEEIEQEVSIGDFTIRTVPARLRRLGDLWKPVLAARGRFPLAELL